AARKKRYHTKRNRHVKIQFFITQTAPGGYKIIPSAIRQHRNGKQDIQIAKKLLKKRTLIAFQTEILRKTHQHDIAKSETGYAEFVIKTAIHNFFTGFIQALQVDSRRIADGRQQFDYFSE